MTDKLSDAWQCQSCGCYFPHIPKILDNDVKRCSKCVEVEVLELERGRFVKANAEVARLNADLAVANIDLEQRLEGVAGGLLWLGNNIHNSGTEQFKTYLLAAIEDAEKALAADLDKLPTQQKPTEEAMEEA